MTKAEKAWFRKTLGIIDRSLKGHGGSLVILGNQITELETTIKNLKLVVEETQRQQRRGSDSPKTAGRLPASGTMKVGNVITKPATPKKQSLRPTRP